MGIRFGLARAISAVSTWGLKNVFHRPAANFPGKIALYADPRLLADLRSRVDASICVVGTNGKTTVTNLLADSLEAAGHTVICNRTGANLDSGVSTALLHGKHSDWGVFECDELWLAKILPFLQSDYVLLLNLFRDQLDRVGEIDHIQQSISGALAKSPRTVLVYNADDPLCQAIADGAPNPAVPFGLAEDLGLAQNTVADARMCQHCSTMLEYRWRQYGQLGDYYCPNCGFSRTVPQFSARDVRIAPEGSSFTVEGPADGDAAKADAAGGGCAESPDRGAADEGRGGCAAHCAEGGAFNASVHTGLAGAYMVYNLLAISAVARLAGISPKAVQQAVDAFDPKNGRLQPYEIDGHAVLLNLAKNPTGFNQNLKIVMNGEGPKAVAFYINDKEADGHDVSWLWDIDFQELSEDPELVAFAGGIRKNDMQVRLKYAGVEAGLVDGAEDFIRKALALSPQAKLYVIANYTALPQVKAELDRLASEQPALSVAQDACPEAASPSATGDGVPSAGQSDRPHLTIAHMFPTLLNLYGDGGNVIVLADRARRRGIDVDVLTVNHGDAVDFSDIDIVFLGGGPDREQHLASQDLLAMADGLRLYVEDDGVLLAICGGFQIIGREWLMGEETVPGLGLVDLTTQRVEGGSHNRLVDNIVLDSPLASHPVVGYENHAGRTYLGDGMQPFGRVTGSHGKGNNDSDKADGVLYRNVVGTYLHGPLLAKNPQVADALIERALERRAQKAGKPLPDLPSLDDSAELAANKYMCERLGVR